MGSKSNIRSEQIVRLLGEKHHKDLFIPECKTGPTQVGSHLRFDAWVMRKSWTNPMVTGYEVKVSKGDFRGDDKWHGYLKFCNELYFVCPQHIIEVGEVPDQAGLMWMTGSGTRIYTKKKAPYRGIVIPDSIWRYILMWRTKVYTEYTEGRCGNAEYWRKWMESRKIDREFG